jgi:hypothetical protein
VFKLNTEEAGHGLNGVLNHHDTFLMETLENQLYVGGFKVPRDYQGLKQRLLTISHNLEKKKLQMGQQAGKGGIFLTPAKDKVVPLTTQKISGTAPNLAKRLGPSETTLMDVNRVQQNPCPFKCYNCNKEGHMKRDCPESSKKKFNICALGTKEDYTQEDL